MADRIASLLALAAGIKSTGDDLISIGGKLHNYADALNTEANAIAEERLKLKKDLAAALALAEKNKNAPFNVDFCVGIRANGNGAVFQKMNCCSGCGGAAGGGAIRGGAGIDGWHGGGDDAKSAMSKALSSVASQATGQGRIFGGGSGASRAGSKRNAGDAGSHMSSSHATQK